VPFSFVVNSRYGMCIDPIVGSITGSPNSHNTLHQNIEQLVDFSCLWILIVFSVLPN